MLNPPFSATIDDDDDDSNIYFRLFPLPVTGIVT